MMGGCSAYWRRGHAARLVNWCTQLADLEGVPVVIMSSHPLHLCTSFIIHLIYERAYPRCPWGP